MTHEKTGVPTLESMSVYYVKTVYPFLISNPWGTDPMTLEALYTVGALRFLKKGRKEIELRMEWHKLMKKVSKDFKNRYPRPINEFEEKTLEIMRFYADFESMIPDNHNYLSNGGFHEHYQAMMNEPEPT